MHRLLAVLTLSFIGLAATPVHAAGTPAHPQRPINWQQRDTAVYVVSTLNVLHTPSGRPLVKRMAAARYDVYGDVTRDDLYFIQLRGRSGSPLGALAYQMGWKMPRGLSSATDHLGVHAAPADIVRAYRTDPKLLLGSFTSTLPE